MVTYSYDIDDKSTWSEFGSSSTAPAKPGAIIMNPRTGELERRPSEEELQREAAERAEKQAEKAREWERARPQREAEQRIQQQKLKKVCAAYYIARQNCASAGNYSKCIEIKLDTTIALTEQDLGLLEFQCRRL